MCGSGNCGCNGNVQTVVFVNDGGCGWNSLDNGCWNNWGSCCNDNWAGWDCGNWCNRCERQNCVCNKKCGRCKRSYNKCRC